jgi:Bbp16
MYIDSLLKVCAAQAFTGAAVSASSIDLGLPGGLGTPPKREIGTGKPMGFAFSVDVAASSTTVKLEVIMTTDAALTAGLIVLVEETRLAADLPAGGLLFLGIPPGGPAAGFLRYLGVRATPAGGAATVTLSAWLTSQDEFSPLMRHYAKNYTP